jgi:hypothetical protein
MNLYKKRQTVRVSSVAKFARFTRLYKLIRFMRLTKLAKLLKGNKKKIIKDSESVLKINSGLERIGFFYLFLLFFLHIMACMLILLH